MLKLKDVSAMVEESIVLNNINLEIKPGEIHAILGPKGSGKSSLAHVIQGNPFIQITSGSILFQNKKINKHPPNKRSQLGIFSTFQYPPEIEGLSNRDLLKAIIESKNGVQYNSDIEDAYKFLLKQVGLDTRFMDDSVNTEIRPVTDWKKGELVQALLIQPDLVVLDEIDADLDDESFGYIVAMIRSFLENKNKSLVLITHSNKLLKEIIPDYVHVMVNGEIREEGGTELYKRIINDGDTQFS
jgi:Fe-S cluster assembly ATP-binding protein